MRRTNVLTTTSAVAAVVAAVLPFAMSGRVRITGPAFVPVLIGLALAGASVTFAAIVVIRSRIPGIIRTLAFGLAVAGLLQATCAAFLSVAFLMPPPYERTLGLLLVTLVLAPLAALLAVIFAFVLRTRKEGINR